jgi:hypothetical protein
VTPQLQLKVLCTDDDSDNEENEARLGDNLTDIYKSLTKSNYLNSNKNINNVAQDDASASLTLQANALNLSAAGLKLPTSLTSHVINHSNSDDLDDDEEDIDDEEDDEDFFENNLEENNFSLLDGQEVFLNNKKIKLTHNNLGKPKKLKNQVRFWVRIFSNT